LHATFLAADTYTFPQQATEAESHKFWIDTPAATFVACECDGKILGTYFIKTNQPGLGDHVCNCGYIVAGNAQGKGIAMQFNFVVATNERAVRLWQRLGFEIVGRLPAAFRHQQLGFVDALIMFKQLVP